MTDPIDLWPLPCPFCGQPPNQATVSRHEVYVWCMGETCPGNLPQDSVAPIKAWNTRNGKYVEFTKTSEGHDAAIKRMFVKYAPGEAQDSPPS